MTVDSVRPTDLSFASYQAESKKTAIYPAIGGGEIYPALGLANEAGELLGKIKKVYRDANGIYDPAALDAITAELGDVLWYCSQLATELGIDLEVAALTNLDKLQSRQRRGRLGGSGDRR